MAPAYAASALLLLALPQGFAAPTNAEVPVHDGSGIVPPFINALAPLAPAPSVGIGLLSPGPAPIDVSPLTGGVLTAPDIVEEPSPLDPGIGDGTIPTDILPIPIEPGIGDGSGPEAFGDPELPDVALPTGAITTIIDMILSDPVPSGQDLPAPTLAIDPPIPEIIGDPLLLPPDQQTATNAIDPPQTLDVESFLSIVQQLADIIRGFFTIQPGRPAPPVGIVPDAVLSSIAATATGAPAAPAASILPILPIDKVTTLFKNLKKRDLSVEQHHLLSEVASKNIELQNVIDSFRKLHAAHLERRSSSVNNSPDTQAITSRVTEILKLIDRVLEPTSQGSVVADTSKAESRSETLPVSKRSKQDIYKTAREFIKNWHTIGMSLGEQDPRFVAELMNVFHDPNINPNEFEKLGTFPESVRKFVQQYYTLAQVLLDAGVTQEDKVDLLKALFDNSQGASRRTISKRDDGRQWDEKKVKDFIKLFWQADPLVQSLSVDSTNQLSAPFTGDYNSKVHSTNKIQYAAIQWTKFRSLLNSLDEDDKQLLTKLLQEGQLVPEKQKRSIRHGLRRRQYGSKHEKPDLGVELDDLPKLGAKLDKILGPSGTLDPMGMTDSYPGDAKMPFYDTESNHIKSNPKAEQSEYDSEAGNYIGDYEDADNTAADFWDPYNQIDTQADEYADVPGGAPENWK